MANSGDPYLTLKWEMGDHLGTYVSKFHSLFQQGKFLDVTLSAEGQFLKAHRLILCASSQYFEEKLTLSKCDTSSLVEMNLGNMKFDDLQQLVDFMYTGEISVVPDQLPSLLKAATTLKIRALINQAQELLKDASTEMNEDPAVENKVEIAEDVTGNLYEEQDDLVVDFPIIKNRGEAGDANYYDDELSDIHKALQLQLSEDEDIVPARETQGIPEGITAMETDDRSSVKRKNSLKDDSVSEGDEQQRRKSLRLTAVLTKTLRNYDDEEDDNNEEDSFDDNESDNEEGCSSTPLMRKVVPKKPTSSSSKEDLTTKKPYKCEKCGIAYKQKTSLARHLKSRCGMEKSYPLFSCSKCDHRSNRKDKLRDHLITIHKVNPSHLEEFGVGYRVRPVLPFKCSVCKRTYNSAHSLRRHVRSHSENKPSFPCSICDFRFPTNSQRRKHLIDVHGVARSNLKDYGAGHLLQCELCSFCGGNRIHLEEHMTKEHINDGNN